MTLVAMLFYEEHYGLDSGTYFELMLTGHTTMIPGVNFRENLMPSLSPLDSLRYTSIDKGIGALNTMRFMMLVGLVTGPYFHAMKVGCAFLGFLGVWWFYRAVVVALGRPFPPAFYLLAFFPSIIFWSSTLGKDPVLFLFLGLYAYGGAMWLVQGRLASFWVIGAGLLGVYLLRPWIGMIAGAALLLATLLGRCRRWQTACALPACALLVAIAGQVQLSTIFSEGRLFGNLVTYDVLAIMLLKRQMIRQ